MTQKGADKLMSEPPSLIVPYMWIGDFVRCHTVVKLLKKRFPSTRIDFLTTTMVAPLLDYMPGVRKGVVADLPRKRLALSDHRALAQRLRAEKYGQALVMPRTWTSALAPSLAGIPCRTGFVGEGRFGLINDLRFGERRLPRMADRCAMLALPKGEATPVQWPLPELKVPASERAAWRQRLGLAPAGRPVVAPAPGAVGPSKGLPAASYADLAPRPADRAISRSAASATIAACATFRSSGSPRRSAKRLDRHARRSELKTLNADRMVFARATNASSTFRTRRRLRRRTAAYACRRPRRSAPAPSAR